MHPHVIGHRSRTSILEELIEHIAGRSCVWWATHAEIPTHVRDQAPTTPSGEVHAHGGSP
ncbi:MAG: hypothetical protein M3069_26905 [Chloroflexota bacterium]|nr:hypothetical protein [Chloroflexota bacterium]